MVANPRVGMLAAMVSRSLGEAETPLQRPTSYSSKGELQRYMALLQQGGLTPAERDAIIRKIAELQATIASEEERLRRQNLLQSQMPGAPGQVPPFRYR